ncbi:hypothetical protein C8A05DRAFT_16262 [Staphylotrichum tortipilum]|uniref:Aminoglycoside phosphotransferase domain-containing protein n=1 Tax=Staphylotrichum tortipilum TaxID=2831512 RepID=A0AAN6RT53_9PEZI|nr:hypothetical protein C8A05DRAFT_16262 [Staphylotrichum longicolle]
MTPAIDENAEARQFALEASLDGICGIIRNRRFRAKAPHFGYPLEQPVVWVKYGDPWMEAEADMQRLAWQLVRDERQAGRCNPGIYIPEVFKTFPNPRDPSIFVVVMELVKGTVLEKSVYAKPRGSLHPVEQCYDLIAEAIQLLRRMPVPHDATPGPYTPNHELRLISHPLFKDQRAGIVFQNIEELEGHINGVPIVSAAPGAPPTVALERELVFAYSDIHDHNFMFNRDHEGILRLYVIDFGHASFLPVSLLAHVVLQNFGCSTPKHIAKRIGATLPVTNIEALGHAAKMLARVRREAGLSRRDSACSLTPVEGLQDQELSAWCRW